MGSSVQQQPEFGKPSSPRVLTPLRPGLRCASHTTGNVGGRSARGPAASFGQRRVLPSRVRQFPHDAEPGRIAGDFGPVLASQRHRHPRLLAAEVSRFAASIWCPWPSDRYRQLPRGSEQFGNMFQRWNGADVAIMRGCRTGSCCRAASAFGKAVTDTADVFSKSGIQIMSPSRRC